jgi:hypothetical protein
MKLSCEPILDPPDATTNFQVNALGLNTKDGFLYGLNAANRISLTANSPLPFYRIGANAVAIQTGNMQGLAMVAGENLSLVNPAACQADRPDNKISVDLSVLSAGIYFLQINDEAGYVSNQKIIKL